MHRCTGRSFANADLVAGQCVDRASSYYTAGGKIYHGPQEIRLKGVNWFGFEGTYLGLHGLWTGRSLESFVDQMQGLGLNAFRIPLSPEALDGWRKGQDGYRSPLAQLNRLIQYAGQKGMYVLLDLHTCSMNNNAQKKPGPATGACSFYSEAQWTANLKTLAGIAAANSNVVGIDLFNEPFGLTYMAWKEMAERAANEVLIANPRVLIFMEGVGNASTPGNYMSFWGENLYEAPHNLPEIVSSRLVFSPHVYGPSVSAADYFQASTFPANMPAIWDSHFGMLARDGHPLVIGEFGGAYTETDKIWQDAFVSYMLKAQLTSSFYWALNPNSGDTKGLLLDDWRSVDQAKLRLLQRLQ